MMERIDSNVSTKQETIADQCETHHAKRFEVRHTLDGCVEI